MPVLRLAGQFALAFLALLVVIGGLLFGSAGTWRYWQGWFYLAAFYLPALAISLYLLVRDPVLLARRMRWREPEWQQRLGQRLMNLFYPLMFVISGLDRRYGWSHVPRALVFVADALIVLGFVLVFRVFQVNQYAATTIEVEPGQQLVSTGPYAVVRHPMYAGALPTLVLAPLALGSYWGLLAALPLLVWAILRLLNEEAVLVRDLPGYDAYCRRVRWRLIPGVW